jgi:ATP-dependent helicase/nuclease subunit B
MKVTYTLLDWEKALLAEVTQRLCAISSAKWIDLSDLIVLVPTVQAGRRLRDELAIYAGKLGGGLLPPRIMTPDTLIVNELERLDVANEACVTSAWIAVLEQINHTHFEALFPVKPALTLTWKIGMARQMMQLCHTLGEDGLSLKATSELANAAGIEAERWRELARLEGLYFDHLKHAQLIDPNYARLSIAESYEAPNTIKSIILAATPDPQPLALRAIQSAATKTQIEIWIYGPKEGDLFDDWGRPLTSKWSERSLDFENWNCQMQSLFDPQEVATQLATSIKESKPESVLIGLADPSLNSVVSDELRAKNIPFFDPNGKPLHLGGIGRIADLLCELTKESSIATVRTILQHPDIMRWLNADTEQQKEILSTIDRLFNKHLTADLDTLRHFNTNEILGGALDQLSDVLTKLRSTKTSFADTIAETLQVIYASSEIHSGSPHYNHFKECAITVRHLLQQTRIAENLFLKLPPQLVRSTFQHSLRQTAVYSDRPSNAHDLLGWLELLWNDAPQLILAGINETIVPESISGDAFLPESLRIKLGLRTNEQRFARDAYLIEALCYRRREKGRVQILVPQMTTDGSPLKPSRLLFLGHSNTLLARTKKLFSPSIKNTGKIIHTLPWKLKPPPSLQSPDSLSVSALNSYLQCPFRFFLKYVLKMQPIDVDTRELSAASFGNLFHDVVELLSEQTLDHQTTVNELKTSLHKHAKNLIIKRYGKKLTFALRLQQEVLLNRLSAFCHRQVEDIQINGRIDSIDTEVDFDGFEIEGYPVNGRIDRVDCRGDRIELIDYKTSDSPKDPKKAHLVKLSQKAPPQHLPKEAFFEYNGKTYRWVNLQLPLYALATQSTTKGSSKVAYFNLGKTLEKSSIQRWEELDELHLDSAHACAAAVIKKIQAGQFWPPNEAVLEAHDDFAGFFPDGIDKSVDSNAFKNYQFA